MFHEFKRHHLGCAIATAAMIADVPYREAAARAGGLSPASLRRLPNLRRLLEEVTPTRWYPRRLFRPARVAEFPFPEWPVAVFLQDSAWWPRFGQWVAARGRLIHDPGLPVASSLREYCRGDWFVRHVLDPARPDLLRHDVSHARLACVIRDLSAEAARPLTGPVPPTSREGS